MISAGKLDRLVQFRRRAPMPASASTPRGWVDVGNPVWAAWKPGSPFRLFNGDMKIHLAAGSLSVRDDDFTSTASAAWRVMLDGKEYIVRSINPPNYDQGTLDFDVMENAGRRIYAEQMDQYGEVIEIRRPGTNIAFPVRAKIVGYRPNELVDGMDQGDRSVTILAEDVEAAGLEGGLLENYALFARGNRLNVQDVDDSTHRVGGELCAYQVTARG
jgi:hypothetical protein